MSENSLEYRAALAYTKTIYKDSKYDIEGRGYTFFDTTSQGDVTIVKQNNTIIYLLLKISEKLDTLNK